MLGCAGVLLSLVWVCRLLEGSGRRGSVFDHDNVDHELVNFKRRTPLT